MSDNIWTKGVSFRKSQPPPSLAQRIFRRTYSNGHYFYGRDPFSKTAVWAIIGLNTAVFGLWQYAQATRDGKLLRQLQDHATLSWQNIQQGRYWTLVTAAFSHQGLGHFFFNMFSFNTFAGMLVAIPGVNVSHIVSLALCSSIASSLAFLYHDRSRMTQRMSNRWGAQGQHFMSNRSGLGASGMVLGFAAVATCLLPFAKIMILPIPVPLPLWVATVGYAALDTYMLDSNRSPVGHSAHLGGTMYGLMFYAAFLRGHGGLWHMIRRSLGR